VAAGLGVHDPLRDVLVVAFGEAADAEEVVVQARSPIASSAMSG
jgi:hypothetical protein